MLCQCMPLMKISLGLLELIIFLFVLFKMKLHDCFISALHISALERWF